MTTLSEDVNSWKAHGIIRRDFRAWRLTRVRVMRSRWQRAPLAYQYAVWAWLRGWR